MTVTETQVERELATAGDWAVSPVSLAAVYRSWVRSEHRGLDEDGITEIKVVPQATSASCCRVGRLGFRHRPRLLLGPVVTKILCLLPLSFTHVFNTLTLSYFPVTGIHGPVEVQSAG